MSDVASVSAAMNRKMCSFSAHAGAQIPQIRSVRLTESERLLQYETEVLKFQIQIQRLELHLNLQSGNQVIQDALC